jgi:membrane peptidoglycan carboxypeptidase
MSAAVRLALAAAGAGLLLAAVLVPVVGAAGVVVRNAANSFNTMSVPSLGQLPSRSTILDSSGNVIAYYYPGGIYRVPVTYNQIAPVMVDAIVSIEDSRYWLHGAFDLRGTARAVVNDFSGGNLQGASTLAQQYVKNALILTATTKAQQAAAIADTTSRKIKELKMAANVEHEMTKQQLLAAYLNVAFFNNNAYGIQVAAARYFSTDAANLTLPEAAMLAGLVENPTEFDPFADPTDTIARRNTVLARMAQNGYITNAQAQAAGKLPLGLKGSSTPLDEGCTSPSAAPDAYFCDYVLAVMRTDKSYAKAYNELLTTGGLTISTTLNPQDQQAADSSVNWVAPYGNNFYNPGNNVDTEVMVQPGTGDIRAIAVNRPYGFGSGLNSVDYAVNTQYDGSTSGVQTGSSSKLFTLLAALKQGVPFGYSQAVVSPTTVSGFTNCAGDSLSPFQVHNSEGSDKGTWTLYNGTTQSINVFYAHLEQKVGLCNVVQTAASLGVTFVNGGSLLKNDSALGQVSADNVPSFTLGAVPVSPMSMAAAYATVAARGTYCTPVAITKITDSNGASLPVESAGCHQVLSPQIADAANYVLQGVLTANGATAAGRGINVPAAGKTGTANGGFYAAFAGYTPTLAGYVSVFNPTHPTTSGAMVGQNDCYREDPAFGGGQDCPLGQMFGDNAPAATWQMSFDRISLPNVGFVGVPGDSPFFSMGPGINSPKPPKKGKPNPNPTPCPLPVIFCPGGGGGGGGLPPTN